MRHPSRFMMVLERVSYTTLGHRSHRLLSGGPLGSYNPSCVWFLDQFVSSHSSVPGIVHHWTTCFSRTVLIFENLIKDIREVLDI